MVIDSTSTIGVIGGTGKLGAATSVLIFLNRSYSVDGAGIRITGELDMTALP